MTFADYLKIAPESGLLELAAILLIVDMSLKKERKWTFKEWTDSAPGGNGSLPIVLTQGQLHVE